MQTVHPNGQDGHLLLSNNYSPSLADYAFTPRVGATYTLNPDTVLRFSAGRYAQEPETYQVQYNAKDNNLAYDLFQAFWQYGYTTPKHDPLVQYSDNYDASYERRFKGTDMSIKVTPYYRYATNQVYSIGLPFGLAGGLNSGVERVDGFEIEFTKGDFDKNGLSFLLSYTYTNAAERWAELSGNDDQSDRSVQPGHRQLQRPDEGRRRLAVLRKRPPRERLSRSELQALKPGYNPPIIESVLLDVAAAAARSQRLVSRRPRFRLPIAQRTQRHR